MGKTTIARAVATRLGFAHHLATGYIRETLRVYLSAEEYPALYDFTFRPPQPDKLIDRFRTQAHLVCKPAQACILRSLREGTNLVLEGNHLLPEFVNRDHTHTYVVLRATPEQIAERVHGSTHRGRTITLTDYRNIIALQDFILEQAKQNRIPIINSDDVYGAVDEIMEIANASAT